MSSMLSGYTLGVIKVQWLFPVVIVDFVSVFCIESLFYSMGTSLSRFTSCNTGERPEAYLIYYRGNCFIDW